VRHLGKYADHPVAPREAFVFRLPDGRRAATTDTLRAFLTALKEVDEKALGYHASRGDFSRWIADIFLDRHLASQIRKIERRWQAADDTPLWRALVALMDGVIPRS
jgi:hypothetical protein